MFCDDKLKNFLFFFSTVQSECFIVNVVHWDTILAAKYFFLEAFDRTVFRLWFEQENWGKVPKEQHQNVGYGLAEQQQ